MQRMVTFSWDRLIIPENLNNRSLQNIHEGHFSVEKIQLRSIESVFWQKIITDILQTAQSYKVCLTFSWSQQRENLMQHEVQQRPWEKIGADFFEFESTNYLLITTTASFQSSGEWGAPWQMPLQNYHLETNQNHYLLASIAYVDFHSL